MGRPVGTDDPCAGTACRQRSYLPPLPRPRTPSISRGERSDHHSLDRLDHRAEAHSHAGAQAQRRQRAGRRQQDRPGGRPGQRRPGRRRPDAGRDPHDQRALRRRHHRRAGPAVDPDGRGDDRRGAAVLPAGRAPAGGLHRQGGPQPGRHVVQPVGRARSRRGPDRRRDGPVRQGQRPQARLRDRRRRPTTASSTSGCARSTTATCCATRSSRLVVETPQYFLLRVACGLAQSPARRSGSTG